MKEIYLYDTTLRDGAQTEGISYSLNDKIRIARKLDEIGIHFIEGGWPANSKDKAFFDELIKKPLKKSCLTAFGSTRRPHINITKDENLKGLLTAQTKVITVFGKTWDLHVRDVLKTTLDENLKMIYETVHYLKTKKKQVFYDAEHFFDAYKNNPEYTLKTLSAAINAGADRIIFCDTNGGTLTEDIKPIISEINRNFKSDFGIHCHNDLGLAIANSITALNSGCTQVQGTFNGYGERCGNADLVAIIGILKLKMGINCVSDIAIKELTKAARFISEVSNMKQEERQPFVGHSAFAHKGGVHINAVLKNSKSYEHIDPKLVGNHRRVLVSELAGKSPILIKAKEMELDLDKNSPRTKKILELLQNLEHKGYAFEAADASFEVLVKKGLGKYKKFFDLDSFRVIIEKRENGKLYSEATIKIRVNNILEQTAAEGDGPVNALDNALRKALLGFYPSLSKMHLSDFKVRVLDEKAGTAAKVRVLIQSQDQAESWTTVGVSENIIEASWQALVDSVEYKLLKDKTK
ncbi:MAG: citramalate synthase [Candidatus Omnitrophota bacterium]